MKIRKEIEDLKPYVPGKPVEEVKRELGLTEVIKLASNESPWPPFDQAVKAMQDNLKEVNRYPDSSAYYLKGEIAFFYGVEREQVVLGNGSNELMRVLANCLLEPGDEILSATPSFVVYPIIAQLMGAKLVEVPLKEHRFDLKEMKSKITPRTKMVFICNPNNPTGTIVGKAEVDEFMQGLPGDILVIFDEAYFEYVEDPSYPDGLDYFKAGASAAVLRSFSKIYSLAGLRIGYGIMSAQLTEVVNRAREPFNVNLLAQAAASASLKAQDEVKKRREMNIANLKKMAGMLEQSGFGYIPTQANFIMVDTGKPSPEVFKNLLQEGIITRTGDIFGQGYESYLRVTIGTEEENERFIKALNKVVKG